MAVRDLRKSRHLTDRELAGALRPVLIAKALARQLISEFARIDLPAAVVGTALAMIVSTVAAEIPAAHREVFYEKFIAAVRESEIDWEIACGRPRHLH